MQLATDSTPKQTYMLSCQKLGIKKKNGKGAISEKQKQMLACVNRRHVIVYIGEKYKREKRNGLKSVTIKPQIEECNQKKTGEMSFFFRE
jgi:hypothetical protein